MKIKSTNIRTPIISFEGIDFLDTSVNDILLKNISDYLKGPKDSKKVKIFPNGIVEHKISRAGYRMLQFPSFVDNLDKFSLYLNANNGFLDSFDYTNSGYFEFEGTFYLIVSKSSSDLSKDLNSFNSRLRNITDEK